MVKVSISKFYFHWKLLLKDRTYLISLLVGLVVCFASLVFTYAMSQYNDVTTYAPVGDLLLDKLPTYNLEFLFLYGFGAVVAIIVFYTLFVKPELVPFMLKTYGILLAVRACFFVLTHTGPPEGFFYSTGVSGSGAFLKRFVFQNDLFFSGHTSIPFLAFLLFKETKIMKWLMLVSSLLMGATVLLMHVHYSIDVFAAFFISFGVYALSNKIFKDLNIRFRHKIKKFGWDAMQRRLKYLREKGGIIIPEYDEVKRKIKEKINK